MLVPLEKPQFDIDFAQVDTRVLSSYQRERAAISQTEQIVKQVAPLWNHLRQEFLKDSIFWNANDSSDANTAKQFGKTLQEVNRTIKAALKFMDVNIKRIQSGGTPDASITPAVSAFKSLSKLVDARKAASAIQWYISALEDEGDYNRDYVRQLSILEDNVRLLENLRRYYLAFRDEYV